MGARLDNPILRPVGLIDDGLALFVSESGVLVVAAALDAVDLGWALPFATRTTGAFLAGAFLDAAALAGLAGFFVRTSSSNSLLPSSPSDDKAASLSPVAESCWYGSSSSSSLLVPFGLAVVVLRPIMN
jgi:hypothetical protein